MAQASNNSSFEDVLATELCRRMTAHELRKWCAENGITRSKGDNKLTTARKAVRQNREAVVRLIVDDRRE